jgi:integrase
MAKHIHKEFRKTFTFEGKRHEVEADTEVELEVAVRIRKQELENGVQKISKQMLVKNWSAIYLEDYRRDYASQKQYKNLKTQMKNITSVIGSMRLTDVRRVHCMRVLSGMNAQRLSKGYLKKVRALMKSMFEEAIENDLMIKNPANKLKLPADTVVMPKKRAATERETQMLLEAGGRLGDPADAYIKLLHYFGLRPTETVRVMGCHFDMPHMRLRVPGQKTENATRDVPIPSHLVEWAKSCADRPFELLMKNHYGDPVSEQGLTRLWKKIKRDVNIAAGCRVYRNKVIAPYYFPGDLTARCLRRKYASDMVGCGIPKEVVSLLMGHADIDTTDIYIRMTTEMFSGAAERMNEKHKTGY